MSGEKTITYYDQGGNIVEKDSSDVVKAHIVETTKQGRVIVDKWVKDKKELAEL